MQVEELTPFLGDVMAVDLRDRLPHGVTFFGAFVTECVTPIP